MSARIGWRRLAGHGEGLDPGWFTFAWCESTEEAVLDTIDRVPDWSDLARWRAGRVFGPHAQYQWRTAGDGVRGVLLIDGAGMPEGFERVVDLEPAGEELLILRGTTVPPGVEVDALAPPTLIDPSLPIAIDFAAGAAPLQSHAAFSFWPAS